jgi:hypothetical protein
MSHKYHHTQIGWTLIVLVLAAVVAEIVLVAVLVPGSTLALSLSGALAAILAVTLVLFSTLTVTVDAAAVRLAFGMEVLRREVPLDEIAEARKVRNAWYSGWGVRVIPNGRLYNVGGLDAVELRLDNGRVVRVGSDEPDVLLMAVQRALDGRKGR